VYGNYGTVGGGRGNRVYQDWGTVGGGNTNTVFGYYGTVGGGGSNAVYGYFGIVGGGHQNYVYGYYGTVGGGYLNKVHERWGTVGGGYGNTVYLHYGTVGGGSGNSVYQDYGTIGGGHGNQVDGLYATIGGGTSNFAAGDLSVVMGSYGEALHESSAVLAFNASGATPCRSQGNGTVNICASGGLYINGVAFTDATSSSSNNGGQPHDGNDPIGSVVASGHASCAATANYSAVLGGQNNTASGTHSAALVGADNLAAAAYAVVVGGSDNAATQDWTFVGGGRRNAAVAIYGTVAGGYGNEVRQDHGTVGGGNGNAAYGPYGTVGGGSDNTLGNNYYCTVGGGHNNFVYGSSGTVGGGQFNTVYRNYGTIAGGDYNAVFKEWGTIGGGYNNKVYQKCATVGGGQHNYVYGYACTVGGGTYNYANGWWGTVGGGHKNTVYQTWSTVGGGQSNTVFGAHGTVGGGYLNTVYGPHGTVGGGREHRVNAYYGAVGGGQYNYVYGYAGTVGGGQYNRVYNDYGTIGGGDGNQVDGLYAMIGGGTSNLATGDLSAVIGSYGEALHESSAVLAFNASGATPCRSQGNGTVNICASGGLYVNGLRVTNQDADFVKSSSPFQAFNASLTRLKQVDVPALKSNVSSLHVSTAALRSEAASLSGDIIDLTDITSKLVMNDSALLTLLEAVAANATAERERLDRTRAAVNVLDDTSTQHSELLDTLTQSATALQFEVKAVHGTVESNSNRISSVNNTLVNAQLVDISRLQDNVTDLRDAQRGLWSSLSSHENNLLEMLVVIDGLSANDSAAEHRVDVMLAEMSRLTVNVSHNSRAIALGLDDILVLAQNATDHQQRLDLLHARDASQASAIAQLRTNMTSQQVDSHENKVGIIELWGVVSGLIVNDSEVNLQIKDIMTSMGHFEVNQSRQSQLIAMALDNVLVLAQNMTDHQNQLDLMDATDATRASTINQLFTNATSQQVKVDRLAAETKDLTEKVAVMNDSDFQQQIEIDGQWIEIGELQDVVAELNATTQYQDGIISQLNGTNFKQKVEIDNLKREIQVMNHTNAAQQVEINELRSALGSVNHTLTSLKLAIEQMARASTFAPFTRSTAAGTTFTPDCTADHHGPCSASTGLPTPMAADVATGPAVTLDACYVYPCISESGKVLIETFGWNRAVVVLANTDTLDFAEDSAAFEFSLQSGSNVLWSTISENPFASFVPSDLEVVSVENYTLGVSVVFGDGQTASHNIRGVRFAAPPSLHSVHTSWVNGSAAVSWFEVAVNATDLTELSYTYRLVDADDGWAFHLDSHAAEAVTIGVPSTRPFVLEVTVTNTYGSSTTCSECSLLIPTKSNFSDAEIWHDVFDQISTLSIGSSVLLSGIDVVVGGFGEDETLFDAFLQLLASNSTSVSQDVAVLYEFLQAGVVDGAMDAIEFIDLRMDAASQGVFAKAADLYGVVVTAEPDPRVGG